MKQRFGVRASPSLDVVLYDNGMPTVVGKARDLSLLGVFVETRTAHLRKHHVVEVELSTWVGNRIYRLPAMVVRNGEHGVGLIFETSDPVTREAIRELLHCEHAMDLAAGS
jgi:hypothetical protein